MKYALDFILFYTLPSFFGLLPYIHYFLFLLYHFLLYFLSFFFSFVSRFCVFAFVRSLALIYQVLTLSCPSTYTHSHGMSWYVLVGLGGYALGMEARLLAYTVHVCWTRACAKLLTRLV